jgi:hypothetical protein
LLSERSTPLSCTFSTSSKTCSHVLHHLGRCSGILRCLGCCRRILRHLERCRCVIRCLGLCRRYIHRLRLCRRVLRRLGLCRHGSAVHCLFLGIPTFESYPYSLVSPHCICIILPLKCQSMTLRSSLMPSSSCSALLFHIYSASSLIWRSTC